MLHKCLRLSSGVHFVNNKQTKNRHFFQRQQLGSYHPDRYKLVWKDILMFTHCPSSGLNKLPFFHCAPLFIPVLLPHTSYWAGRNEMFRKPVNITFQIPVILSKEELVKQHFVRHTAKCVITFPSSPPVTSAAPQTAGRRRRLRQPYSSVTPLKSGPPPL